MLKKNFKSLLSIGVCLLICVGTLTAQQEISSEKKALIQEFRELIGMQNTSFSADFTSADIQDTFTDLVEKDKELNEFQKQELRRSVAESKGRIKTLFEGFFGDKAGMKQLSEDITFQLYDKTFSESELREMVAFYKTPTGQKSAKFLRSVSSQLQKAFGEGLSQKLREFITPKIQDEIELLQKKIAEVKNRKTEG